MKESKNNDSQQFHQYQHYTLAVVLIQHKQSDYVTLFQVRFVDIGGIVDYRCFCFLS
jgi:hypothetical protein